ncbi:plasmid mobilization relaxosome protein MobC [Asaia sp. W19]|uniref:MobC family plasmid mobilization relaxosome protein n=1 Tax=unclassified Asaia TaxID=2685023 RepID=UPI000F8EC26F|nr:MobC family plasmid mobilization relaxosome protein [Asaia sp. W19]RUT25692.1 plasmid mobilization relaxosome protein MobC [Asaia sp. W19]
MSASPLVPVPVTPPVSSLSRPARSSRLSVRASPDELAAWAGTARLLGHETTALWVRSLLQEASLTGHDGMAVGASLRKLRGELGRIGNNLNQLAHYANCGDAVRAGNVLDALEKTKDRVDVLLKSLRVTRTSRTSRQRKMVEPETGIDAGASQTPATSPTTLH